MANKPNERGGRETTFKKRMKFMAQIALEIGPQFSTCRDYSEPTAMDGGEGKLMFNEHCARCFISIMEQLG